MFEKIKEGFSNKFHSIFNSKKELNEIIDDLEETLILSDVSASLASNICEKIKKEVKGYKEYNEENIKEALKKELINILNIEDNSDIKEIIEDKKIILVVGVNGTGKTTSIAKIANMYKNRGKKILLCGADTYRAGAVEQLQVWADRLNLSLISSLDKVDPSSVVFDATQIFKTSSHDILIIDTAGRLQNKKNLMEELEKIKRTIYKNMESKNVEVLMILDAVAGQNIISQVKSFYDSSGIDTIMLTKMDSTSKGGVIFSIVNEFKIPIKYIGTGEKLENIEVFDNRKFVDQIF